LQAETHSDSPTPEDFASLCAAISEKQYGQLLPLDQLKLEQAAGRVFAGFSEGEINFAPTFKVRAVVVNAFGICLCDECIEGLISTPPRLEADEGQTARQYGSTADRTTDLDYVRCHCCCRCCRVSFGLQWLARRRK
jgi:hypothetical protein